MSAILDALKEKRTTAHNAATAILDTAGEKSLTAEQRTAFDGFNTQVDDFDAEIATAIRREQHERAEARGLTSAASPTETRSAKGFLPSFTEYRALAEGTGSAGGYVVPTQALEEAFLYLRAKGVVLGSGIRVLEMDGVQLNVPRVSAGTAVGVYAEAATLTAADPTFAQTQLIAKKCGALTLVSNEVLEDSNPSVRQLASQDHLAQLALFLDAQFLQGSGSGVNMRGIRNLSGVTVTPLAANGAQPTLDNFADALARAQIANNDASTLVWFMHPRTWGEIRKLKDGQTRYYLEPAPTLDAPYSLFGVPVKLSSQINIAETVGTGTTCSWAALVNTEQVVIGKRREITVAYSTDYAFTADQTAIRTTARFDIGLLDPNGVQILSGIL